MPQRVICYGCNHLLYEGTDFSNLTELVQSYGCVCPKCGRNLSFLPLNIDVKPVNK